MSERLRGEQALFWRAISWPTGVDDFLAQSDDATREAFGRMVAGDARLSATRRMGIYADSYFYRLADVLREQYRVLAWIVGMVRFHDLVTDFVWKQPSRSPDVRRFGQGLPEFLGKHPLEAAHPGLAELAEVERAIVTAIDRPDPAHGMVERSALQAIEAERWPGLRLHLAEHVQVLSTRRSYPRFFVAWRDDVPSPDPIPPVPEDGPFHVLVWRNGLEVFHRALGPAQAAALRTLAAGRTFEAMCDVAVEVDPSLDPGALVGWLSTWIDDALFCALDA